jgi:hypothetical protein
MEANCDLSCVAAKILSHETNIPWQQFAYSVEKIMIGLGFFELLIIGAIVVVLGAVVAGVVVAISIGSRRE